MIRPGLRVLIADDNANNRTVAQAFLTALGFEAILAENGEEALACLRAADIDIVLMDIRMPVMDWVEAARCIRAGETPKHDLPLVALTADTMSETANTIWLRASMTTCQSRWIRRCSSRF